MEELDKLDKYAQKRSTTEFKRPLGLDEARELLEFLASELSLRINYDSIKRYALLPESENFSEIIENKRAVSLEGVITSKLPFITEDFKLLPNFSNPRKFSSFQYVLTLGYSLEQYSKETKLLWDKTRDAILKYFDERPSPQNIN